MSLETYKRTKLHRCDEIRAAKAHHDRIRVSVDDRRVVLVAVRSVVLCLHLLRRKGSSASDVCGREGQRRTCFVCSIISRPYAVTLIEIGRQGSLPTVAPVNPYTELALTYAWVDRISV